MKKLLFSVLIFLCNAAISQTVIQMKREGGVSIIPCKVNGLQLSFIFDTGASEVTISLTEATFMLKNGYLSKDDIIGTSNYSDANGDISEGINVLLREIEIQQLKLYNVKAAIVKNLDAPLLLGQTAISKLGVVQLDLNSNTLTILSNTSTKKNKKINNTNKNGCQDYDGNIYKTVKIGTQVWMAENLNVEHFQNGDLIPEIRSSEEWEKAGLNKQPAWCYYNNDPANAEKFGKLYNWYAVFDSRGLSPDGWHIPTDREWNILLKCIDPSAKIKDFPISYDAPEAMIENKGGDWKCKIFGTTNKSGFTGLPGGYSTNGFRLRADESDSLRFSDIGIGGTWWSCTIGITENRACGRYLGRITSNCDERFRPVFELRDCWNTYGYSVRCVRN